MRANIRTYSFALAATLAATGAFSISAAIGTAPEAEAFGFGDVWNGAKKVGKTAAKVGKGAYDASKGIDKAIRKGTTEAVGRVTGEFVGQVGGRIVEGIRNGRAPTKEELDRARNGVKDFVTGAQDRLERGIDRERRAVGDTIKEAGGAIRNTAKDIANGLVRVGKPPAVTPRAPAQPGWGRPVGQLRSTLRAPVKGITRKDLGIKRSAKGALGNDRSIYGRPVGQKNRKSDRAGKRPLGNDRSIWGRPVGVKGQKGKRQIGNDRSIYGRPVFAPTKHGSRVKTPGRKVHGITRQNLNPASKVGRNKAKSTRQLGGNDRKRRDTRMAGGSKKKARNNRRRNGRGRRR